MFKPYAPLGNLLRRLQVPPEPSALQFPDVSQPDLQPASPGVVPPVSTRSGRIVRRPAYLRDFTN